MLNPAFEILKNMKFTKKIIWIIVVSVVNLRYEPNWKTILPLWHYGLGEDRDAADHGV